MGIKVGVIVKYFKKMRGFDTSPPRKPLSKIAWSWLGSFLGIYLIGVLSQYASDDLRSSFFLIASFGASAVLVFGAPQLDFSQPRNLLGGQALSALTGVALYKYLSLDIITLAALSVSVSILIMHLTRTLHPPGGATALIAVIGSDKLHEMGYMFVLTPVLLGSLVMLTVALLVNNLSANEKRRYPRYWL